MARDKLSRIFVTNEGPIEFIIPMLDVKSSWATFVRVSKIVAPAAPKAAGVEHGNLQPMGEAFAALVAQLDPSDFDTILWPLLSGTMIQTKEGTPLLTSALLNELFAGRFDEFLKLAGFALEINFKVFYNALVAAFTPKTMGATSTPAVSPGLPSA